jgi:hypothetical protein
MSVRIDDIGTYCSISSRRSTKLMDGLVGHDLVGKRKDNRKDKDRKGK